MTQEKKDGLTDNEVTDKFDTYDYTFEASEFRKILWGCAGADIQLLKKSPHSERVMMEGIGGVVLATAVLAAISGGFAFYTIFGPKVGIGLADASESSAPALIGALIFAAIWSAIIFNLDRFIVSSTGDGDGTDAITWGEFGRTLPRLVMAIFIGVSISAPLEIRVMKSELDARINTDQRAESARQRKMVDDRFEKQLAALDALIGEPQAELKRLQDAVAKTKQNEEAARIQRDNQITGKNGETPGVGPKWQALDASYQAAKAQADAAVADLERQKTALESKLSGQRSQRGEVEKARDLEYRQVDQQVGNIDGLATRIMLSHEIHPVVAYALMALLVMIEISPIFFKMMLTKGPYKYLVENQKYIVLAKWGIEAKKHYAQPKPQSRIAKFISGAFHSSAEPASGAMGPSRGAAEGVVADRFHQPETLLNYQRGQLQVEQALTDLQLQQYRAQRAEEIQRGAT